MLKGWDASMVKGNSNLAINGGKPYKEDSFPAWPYHDENEIKLLTEVVESGKWWRTVGTKVAEFEKKFAKLQECEYCLAVTSGTHALEIAMASLGITRGDEVIVPAFTYISTCSAVIYCNATPVLVDVDANTFCMDPEAFEKAITPKTKAVIPVHTAGHPCDMDKICQIAKEHNIYVIEDAAHAHNGSYKGKKLGSFGDVGIFSFQNGKLMTCGEGGALVTNNKELYEKAFLIHGVGRPKNDKGYTHAIVGSTCRMSEFHAAVLLAQIERVSEMKKKRIENWSYLDSLMNKIDGITPQKVADYAVEGMTHYMYMFYYDSKKFGGKTRQEFVDVLRAEGIPSFIAFPVLSNTQFFKESNFGGRISNYDCENESDLTNAKRIDSDVVWVPQYTLLGTKKDMQDIAGAVKKIQKAFCGDENYEI